MKNLLLILLLSVTTLVYSKTIHLELKQNKTYWIKQTSIKILPGDTLLLSGKAESIVFVNFKGTKENPIVITSNDKVYIEYSGTRGIGLNNCHHVILSGKNSAYQYGIIINATNKTHEAALNIYNLSSDIEIAGIEIASAGFAGIMAKTDPNKHKPKTWRENYVLDNLIIHDNYIRNTKGEGMYIGYYTYGKVDGILPHSVKNLKIYNNIIEYTKWDGIQVACADTNTKIYNNKIKFFGLANKFAQNSGMSINSGFNGSIYNNTIEYGTGNAINIMPLDSANIYNNTIKQINKDAYGIYIQNNNVMHNNCVVSIKNNFIEAGTALYVHNKDNVTEFKEVLFTNNTIKILKEEFQIIPRSIFNTKYLKINNTIVN